jgi:hypothetical protein
MGEDTWDVQNVNDVLLRFGKTLSVARKRYVGFLEEGLKEEPDIFSKIRLSNNEIENMRDTGSWVIGNKEFVTRALKNHERNRQLKLAATLSGPSIKEIAEGICRMMDIDIREVAKKGRNSPGSIARKIISYTAVRKYRLPVGMVAGYFGVTSPAVSNMLNNGEELMESMKIDY